MRNLIKSAGGRRPALDFVAHTAFARVGAYRHLRRVEWGSVRRLVFVCSGNICRSPYAAERARQKGFLVASLGVDAIGNAPADPAAQSTALRRGIDLASHVSTSLDSFRTQEGDLFLGLEPRHLSPLGRLSDSIRLRSTLLGLWCNRPFPYLPDPYGRSPECFDFVFGLVDEALDNIATQTGRRA